MKKLLILSLLFISFLLIGSFTLTAAVSKTITIINNSGNPVYIYDWDMGLSPAVTTPPVAKLYPPKKGKGGTFSLTLKKASKPSVAARRVYISDKELNNSLNKSKTPTMPDPFNYSADATAQYSFFEYNYDDPANTTSSKSYTIDLSYIDEYSYPLTMKFSNVGTYKGCVKDHEYGIKSISSVKKALTLETDYLWSALIWPNMVKCPWNSRDYPIGMVRVIGPNKVWTQNPGSIIIGNWVPDSYLPFIQSLPKTGTQLFGTKTAQTTNWHGWEKWKYTNTPSPSNTGYVEALHSAATPDSNTPQKYGFFCYPRDNTDGEFTYVPDTVDCTVTVYSLSS